VKEPKSGHRLRDLPAGSVERQDGPPGAGQTGSMEGCSHILSSACDIRNSLSVEEAGEVFRESFSYVGRSMGIDRWIVTVLDGECRKVDPLVWYDVDAVDPMIPQWFDQDPNVADRVRRWFTRSKEGEVQRWHLPAEEPGARGEMIDVFSRAGIKSGVSIPLSYKGPVTATFSAFTTHSYRSWPDESIPFFRFVGESYMAMLRCSNLAETLRGTAPWKRIASKESAPPARAFVQNSGQHEFASLVGESEVLQTVLTKIRQVAPTKATVLILGETGVGKGVVARAIHDASPRRDRAFVQVNCAALAPSLLESELFGHEKGAFTSAVNRHSGRFEIADGSTLFLDEIGDFPPELQSKLLRVLDDGEFERIGSNRTIRTDVRIIAATNRDLVKDVDAGRFRRDLWYRLSVFPLSIPPLRERRDDIEPLIDHFIRRWEKRAGKVFEPVAPQMMSRLLRFSWPGNVRELENLIERAAISADDNRLSIEIPVSSPLLPPLVHGTLENVEREHILSMLESANWRIQGVDGAARRLGLHPSTLRSRMKNLSIFRPGSHKECYPPC